MSLDKLKLNKRLHKSMVDLGYYAAKDFQLKALSRIVGGHSIIGIAPDGAGKTTTYVLGVLMRLKYTQDEAPKVLVLAPNEDKISEIVERFLTISRNKDLHIVGLKASGSMEEEIEGLVLGTDIVVATPTRARAVYLKLGLNLNRIQMFIVDDAQEIVKQGMQTTVRELAQSCGKVQYLAFSTVEHDKLHLMIDPFMPFAPVIEVEELGDEMVETHELLLYRVPNFGTKINLLNTLLRDEEVFNKVIIFVNNERTAQKLGDSLQHNHLGRVQIVAHERDEEIDLRGIPFIFHFEIPEDLDVFVKYVLKTSDDDVLSITFATDIELPELKKIEQTLGKKIPVMPLPEG